MQSCKRANVFQGGHRKNDREVQSSSFNVIVKAQWKWRALKKKKKKEKKRNERKKSHLPRIYLGVLSANGKRKLKHYTPWVSY